MSSVGSCRQRLSRRWEISCHFSKLGPFFHMQETDRDDPGKGKRVVREHPVYVAAGANRASPDAPLQPVGDLGHPS